MNKMKKDTRTRNWAFVVYPESAPEKWRELIDENHVPWIESPLHDKDMNSDGTVKKSHWHILIMFDGKKSYEQVKEITNQVKASNPQKVANTKGMVRYFAHVDNPEKYQYDKKAIIGHVGADVASFFELTIAQKEEILEEIEDFVLENDITTFSYLIRYAKRQHPEWMDVLRKNSTIYLTALIKGIWQEHREQIHENRDTEG
ncbi:replication protein [Tetragenococcus halophilus]|uniref:replication protein n=1 Tax=Tetragenococcus halophilus TaxID=51669 RepID=UPI00300FCB61